MFIKIKRADGCIEFFETERFLVSKTNEMASIILKIEIRDNKGKKVYFWKRKNIRKYLKTYIPDKIETPENI